MSAPKTTRLSALAVMALASLEWVPPPAFPGGKPVIEVPGLTPTARLVVVEPELVTVDPAKTEYAFEATRVGAVAASLPAAKMPASSKADTIKLPRAANFALG